MNSKKKLNKIIKNIDKYKNDIVTIKSGNFENISQNREYQEQKQDKINFSEFVFQIEKNSFMNIDIKLFKKELKTIYKRVDNLKKVYNDIALCFNIKRELNSTSEVIKQSAEFLIIDNLKDIENNKKLYPSKEACEQLLEADKNEDFIKNFKDRKKEKSVELISQGKTDEAIKVLSQNLDITTKNKDKSFHYIPYDFKQSGFEKDILEQIFSLPAFNNNLEIYYNGERGVTEFVIECYKKLKNSYKYIGKYTTDFLIIKRDKENQIEKILILETKGQGYANDESFKAKKEFITNEFITKNNKAFGYDKFNFLYLEDSVSLNDNLIKLDKKIKGFFDAN